MNSKEQREKIVADLRELEKNPGYVDDALKPIIEFATSKTDFSTTEQHQRYLYEVAQDLWVIRDATSFSESLEIQKFSAEVKTLIHKISIMMLVNTSKQNQLEKEQVNGKTS